MIIDWISSVPLCFSRENPWEWNPCRGKNGSSQLKCVYTSRNDRRWKMLSQGLKMRKCDSATKKVQYMHGNRKGTIKHTHTRRQTLIKCVYNVLRKYTESYDFGLMCDRVRSLSNDTKKRCLHSQRRYIGRNQWMASAMLKSLRFSFCVGLCYVQGPLSSFHVTCNKKKATNRPVEDTYLRIQTYVDTFWTLTSAHSPCKHRTITKFSISESTDKCSRWKIKREPNFAYIRLTCLANWTATDRKGTEEKNVYCMLSFTHLHT